MRVPQNIIPNKGFALISTITLMTLLMVLCLGFVQLSTHTSKATDSEKHQQIAKANAKLALTIALGELQKYMGPDQRVSATASILDNDTNTAELEGVANPHWVGSWRTDGLKDDPPNTGLIQYKDGPTTDQRSLDYQRSEEVLKWLVSGNEVSPEAELTGDDVISMMKAPDGDNNALNVKVKKVSVSSQGNYAYWVSDEGVKARVNLTKDLNEAPPSFGDTPSYQKILSPKTFNLAHIFPTQPELSSEDLSKMIHKNQLELAELGISDPRTSIFKLNHDITTTSQSVLSNTFSGGLKSNLTAYLHSSGSVPSLKSLKGTSDLSLINDGMLERDRIGPKMGALREWYNLRKLTSGSRGKRQIDMTYPTFNNYNTASVAEFTTQPIQPVLLDASFQTKYSYHKTSKELYELIYPRAVIWNPYNIRLKTPKLYVLMDFRVNDNPKFFYKYKDGSETKEGSIDVSINYNFGYSAKNRMVFMIPSMTFEPGECLHFTTSRSGSMLYSKARSYARGSESIDQNELSPTSDPADLYCFYRKVYDGNGNGSVVKKLPNDVIMSSLDFRYGGGILWNNAKETQSVHLFAAKSNGKATVLDLGTPDFPAIQKTYLDNFSRGNNGRWLPSYDKPEYPLAIDEMLSSNEQPDSLMGFGMRWKHFYESYSNRVYGTALKEPWYTAPIVHTNVRARSIHRWHNDNMFGMKYTGANTDSGAESNTAGARAHLYSYGPISQTRQFPEWSEVINSVDSSSGKYRTGPFFDATSASSEISLYPLFDIPDKELNLHSIGAFQHAQFSPHVWHPSYIIGNGFASPYVAPESTSLTASEEREVWSSKVSKLNSNNNANVHSLTEIGANPLVYDISYETNLLLWDKFFLSSVPHDTSANGWDGDRWDTNIPLPNSRLQIRQDAIDSNQRALLTDYHKAAQKLMINGAFNINSTSRVAWEAMLRSFNGIKLQSREGKSYSANPFSRFITPQKGATIGEDATDSELWGGYRDLSDDEITKLAEKIVTQVKKRAPFIGVGDFVNRRLGTPNGKDDELYFFGTLQAAINHSGINNQLDSTEYNDFNLPNAQEAEENFTYGADFWGGPARHPIAQQYKVFEYEDSDSNKTHNLSEAAGSSGYLSQADILQQIGSVLTARSDTFTIRCYGDSVDSNDKVIASAWCEAVVQRIPDPIAPDEASNNLNPDNLNPNNYGRKFIITSFRWLNAKETSLK